MKTELRDKFYGQTIEEWIQKIPAELPVDAVGLWQIVSSDAKDLGYLEMSWPTSYAEVLLRCWQKGPCQLLAHQMVSMFGLQ